MVGKGREARLDETGIPQPSVLRLLEALLFTAAGPVPEASLRAWLGNPDEETLRAWVARLARHLAERDSALTVRWVGDGVELCTCPDLDAALRQARQPQPEPLSHAAWETLAVIAYRQPLTRLEIEAIRGVGSERALATLVERGLVEEVGRKAVPGRPLLYATTRRFLQQFGLASLAELPPLAEAAPPPHNLAPGVTS